MTVFKFIIVSSNNSYFLYKERKCSIGKSTKLFFWGGGRMKKGISLQHKPRSQQSQTIMSNSKVFIHSLLMVVNGKKAALIVLQFVVQLGSVGNL